MMRGDRLTVQTLLTSARRQQPRRPASLAGRHASPTGLVAAFVLGAMLVAIAPGPAAAGPVSAVVEVVGDVQLESEQNSWPLSPGDLVPGGKKVKLPENSQLELTSLKTGSSQRLQGPSEAVIGDDGLLHQVTGGKIEDREALKLPEGGLDLPLAATQIVGAMSANQSAPGGGSGDDKNPEPPVLNPQSPPIRSDATGGTQGARITGVGTGGVLTVPPTPMPSKPPIIHDNAFGSNELIPSPDPELATPPQQQEETTPTIADLEARADDAQVAGAPDPTGKVAGSGSDGSGAGATRTGIPLDAEGDRAKSEPRSVRQVLPLPPDWTVVALPEPVQVIAGPRPIKDIDPKQWVGLVVEFPPGFASGTAKFRAGDQDRELPLLAPTDVISVREALRYELAGALLQAARIWVLRATQAEHDTHRRVVGRHLERLHQKLLIAPSR